jgi:hypothetical protein
MCGQDPGLQRGSAQVLQSGTAGEESRLGINDNPGWVLITRYVADFIYTIRGINCVRVVPFDEVL